MISPLLLQLGAAEVSYCSIFILYFIVLPVFRAFICLVLSEPEIVTIFSLEMVQIIYTWYESLYYYPK